MEDKKYKLIRSRFLLPFSEEIGTDTRIEDGYVLTFETKILEAGKYSAEKGDEILNKYKNDLLVVGAERLPQSGKDIPQLRGVTMPGFVKAHGHDHESPLIGIAKDEPLADWLDHAVNLFTGFMNEKNEFLCNKLGMSPNLATYLKARVDDIYYGITSCMVHHCNHNKYKVDEIFKANMQAGTKMIVAVGGQDRHYDERILDKPGEAVRRLDDYLEKYGNSELVRIIPGPDQFFSNGPEQLKSLKKWSRDNKTLIHVHSSEEPRTTEWFKETYKMTPIEYAKSIDFLDENTIVAHQVNNTENDLKILKETGTKVVHNPLANAILGSGMPPIVKMLEMGIPVAISTDGSGSADHQNMILAAKLASQYQKAVNQDARVMPAQQVLEMTNVIPAKFLGYKTGQLRKEYDADIIFLEMTDPHLRPTRIDTLVENLVWCANGSEVTHVIANGKVLLRDRKFTTLDAEDIMEKVELLASLMIQHRETASEITGTGARDQNRR
ncbi:amidohydrolase family protein [bacterium]|nr:amidohydrolase family protein [bacterium]